MAIVYGLPQTLTGAEIVNIQQMQNGQLTLCSAPLSLVVAYFLAQAPAGSEVTSAALATLAANLPTAPTSGTKTLWLDNGVLTYS